MAEGKKFYQYTAIDEYSCLVFDYNKLKIMQANQQLKQARKQLKNCFRAQLVEKVKKSLNQSLLTQIKK